MNSFIRKPFKYTYKNACLALIAINVAVFALTQLLRLAGFKQFETYLALIPPLTIHEKMYWQVFTYQFLHADIWHLFFNMLTLFFFGIPLEQKIGSKEFVLFYVLCGTLCGLAGLAIYYVTFLQSMQIIAVIGASGTVFSIMFAFAVLHPSALIYIWGIIPIPAPILILVYAGMELYNAVFVQDGVAHAIHLLGLIWAFLYMFIRFGINPARMWKNMFR